MGKTATINVRVDEADKIAAEQVLQKLGLPMSTLINLLLKQVAIKKSVPFDLSLDKGPRRIQVDHLTSQELKDMLVSAYKEAEIDPGRSLSQVMEDFENRWK
ncbi:MULTISPECIES: type II toxin-antitoxin system RelB/DinJ family antitoxin [unclassified Streptococcus]|uniref:type II toxin-antitoxin system RelB/DinJ family antitoxin n=1 Tax=unclassified Streptococcus TaxID=2608887 RepID=UPI0018A91AA3|nr:MULTISPECIES: type II toxin-antitoxin system RelB/DinJ family antitoxin [unclassified Streptococcus]MBF8970914.1 type II toxin-antitoxin system RelB/DinJ family antitoxin [Streptococcus sp. NLN76]MBG9367161.1 type II toxin-antitoxin system RelB/DinJ family antitoxin [Streptococcus sp. NLN64]